jgi:glycerol-3-phosphate O-acyltransferase
VRWPTVQLPLWLAIVLALLAAWAALDRLLLPGVRWFFRRRVNRVLEEINTRLNIRLQPFKLTKRQVLIDRLLYDPKVQETAQAFAADRGMPRAVVMKRVESYAREIVPAFNAYLYFRMGYACARWLARSLYRVRLGFSDESALSAIGQDSTVVFVMNHRSNMDYVLVAYLAAEKAALSYAVGEWARIWPLHTLIRAMGAYFVRRDSGDPLYRRVLERYVAMATAAGVTQAIFPEGGLSRDGKLRPPKLGLLDYMLREFDPDAGRDIVFVPVGVNYDRTLEDRNLLSRFSSEGKDVPPAAAVWGVARFALRNVGLMLRNRWYRFGYACVNFGTPLSLRSYARGRGLDLGRLGREERFARVGDLALELMTRVGHVIPVLPVALAATVFLRQVGAGLSELELKGEVFDLMQVLEARGAHVYVPRRDQDYAIAVGLRMLKLRHLVEERQGLWAAREEERPLLAYYANSIAHFFQ